jgi:ribosomal protein S6--L-glutamate ligase
MRIVVLSSGEGWHVRDLRRAAGSTGHAVEAVDFRKLSAAVDCHCSEQDALRFLNGYDGILVRTMPPGSLEQVVFRMDLLHVLHDRGIRVLNPPRAVEACVDKYLTSARLARAGIRVPPTIVCQTADAALEAFAALGLDVVVKPLFGSEGRGMIRINDPEVAWRTFHTLERLQAVLYLQRFIRHPGWDLRVFVLGERILGAMRRHSRGDWRTNVAQGGRAELAHIEPEAEALALRSAAASGARVAGIDLLTGPEGDWYVLEVNAVPGWRALAPVIGVDVAAAIIAYLADGA